MYENNKIGLFKVDKCENFEGTVDFDIKPKLFLSYSKAYEYVLEAFKRNGRCMPWREQYSFSYDRKDYGPIAAFNSVRISMVLPFYLQVGKEWL